jgi:hypothetical protein
MNSLMRMIGLFCLVVVVVSTNTEVSEQLKLLLSKIDHKGSGDVMA